MDNSLPTLAFIKTLVHFSAGGGWGGWPYISGRWGELTWAAENLTKKSVAGTLILQKIPVLLLRINVSLRVRENHTSLFS